ncbi:MAG: hypothetical protein ACYC9M_15850, partial [Desulfobulbaceae bacterium]
PTPTGLKIISDITRITSFSFTANLGFKFVLSDVLTLLSGTGRVVDMNHHYWSISSSPRVNSLCTISPAGPRRCSQFSVTSAASSLVSSGNPEAGGGMETGLFFAVLVITVSTTKS